MKKKYRKDIYIYICFLIQTTIGRHRVFINHTEASCFLVQHVSFLETNRKKTIFDKLNINAFDVNKISILFFFSLL